MLWLDSLELRAFITVFTEGAAFDFIPIRTQQPLPVRIIINVIDTLAKHRAEGFEHSERFRACSG